MRYLDYTFLLPPFSATVLSTEIVDEYFAQLPPATLICLDILSDGAEIDEDVPFSHNRLLQTLQSKIVDASVTDGNLVLLLETFEYIDFRYALIYFLEIQEFFSVNRIFACMRENNLTIFMQRLNTLLSILCSELLCSDDHKLLS